MSKSILSIGKISTNEPVEIPMDVLKRHIVCLGASGSGKTVISKCIVEEAVRNNIPVIVIDPQGDLASLGIISDSEKTTGNGTDSSSIKEYSSKAEVRIFTPASSKGLPLSIDPLKLPLSGQSSEQIIQSIDATSADLTELMGFKIESDDGEAVKYYLYLILENAWKAGYEVSNLKLLANLLSNPSELSLKDNLISDRLRKKLLLKMNNLSTGMNGLLFNSGTQFSIETMITPVVEGKIPINVIYLNTLNSDVHKQFFVSSIGREIYNWMLQNPKEDVQLLFCIDEVAPYLPPHPNNPPAKTGLQLLFKQGRKYGVSCLMCTQNPADIDYKSMAQANTWILGRLMVKQDLNKVRHMMQGDNATIVETLPTLNSGEFVLICPDVYDVPINMRMRWLITKHETLDEDALRGVMTNEVIEYFDLGMGMTTSRKPLVTLDNSRQINEFNIDCENNVKYDSTVLVENRNQSNSYTIDAPKINFTNNKDLTDAIKVQNINLMFKLNYPQNKAVKKVRPYLAGSNFKKTEKIVDAKLKLIPIWQIMCKVEKWNGPFGFDIRVPFFGKKIIKKEDMYFSAVDNEFVSLKSGKIRFLKTLQNDKIRFNNFRSSKIDKVELPSHYTELVIEPKILSEKAENLAMSMFGVETISNQLVCLPIWIFTLRSNTGRDRTLLLDGVLGTKVKQ